MKVAAIMALFIMQVCLFSVRLSAQKPAKYYDAAGKELSKAEFDYIERTQNYLGVIVDSSANAHQLVWREEWGIVPSVDSIYSKLETATGKSIDRNKYLVILYYPGKDRSNSSGSATPDDYARYDSELARNIQKIAPTQVIHIYKDPTGLKKLYGNLSKHYQDPETIIERTFFKYHYPCGSYVIIRPDGAYGSYFGEYAYEDILERAKALKKKK